MTEIPKTEIRRLLRSRSREAFDWLWTTYGSQLFGMIRAVVQEEAVAEKLLEDSFVDIWESMKEYPDHEHRFFIWMVRRVHQRICVYLRSTENELRAGTGSAEGCRQEAGILKLLKKQGTHEYPGIY